MLIIRRAMTQRNEEISHDFERRFHMTTLGEFLHRLLREKLTLNELSVLVEAGFGGFTREELLKNTGRVPVGVYTPAALTRTLQKLLGKGLVVALPRPDGKPFYQLAEGCEGYGPYTGILLAVARSRVMTLNTLRTALQLIENENHPSSARYLAGQLGLPPDYLASAVLPRMCEIGLVKKEVFPRVEGRKHHTREDDSSWDSKLLLASLHTGWEGHADEVWL